MKTLIVLCSIVTSAGNVVVKTDKAPAAIGPYSQGIFDTDNKVLYAAGQIGMDPKTGVLATGVEAQAERALTNVAAIFEAAQTWAGPSFSLLDASECLVVLANISDYEVVNGAYAAAFKGANGYPARAAFQVGKLPKAAFVEVKCIGIATRRQEVKTEEAPKAIGPYSQAIAHLDGETLYAAGQIGMDPHNGSLGATIEEQTLQALRNVRSIFVDSPWGFGKQGQQLQNATECLVALADLKDYEAVNKIYASFFSSPFPARAAFQVGALPKGALVEIKCTGFARDAAAVKTADAPAAIGPYSQGIVTDRGVLYAAGQIGIDPKTGELVDGVTPQATRALANVAAIFKAAQKWLGPQFSLLNATECLVALADIADYAEVNKVYAAAFDGATAFPARAAFQVGALPKNARVEVKCTGVGPYGHPLTAQTAETLVV